MTNLEQLLSQLQGLGVRLWLDGERLRCSAPKGVLTPTLQQGLAAHKAGLIEMLRAAEPAQNPAPPPLRRAPRNGPIPLSFGQRRLWFLHQMDPASPVYNIPSHHPMAGSLDLDLLRASLQDLVRRHEILRTHFPVVDGQPVQRIEPALELPLPVIDLSDLPRADVTQEVQRRGNEELRRPFDLARGPLIRASVLRLPAEIHFLMITLHHIVTDGWSLALMHQELETVYTALVSGQPSPLPEPELQYADYACWQRDWLQSGAIDSQLAYWRKQLAGPLPILELPADRPRPPVQTFNGSQQFFSFDRALRDGLKGLAQEAEATLFMTVLAAFKVLLLRYTGQEDILVGASNGNRPRVELEKMLGFFVNTQVLRTDASGDPTFLELLARVRKVTLEAYARQDLPFEKLVEDLQPPRDLSHTPLFQVMFTIQNTPLEFYARESASPDKMRIQQGASKFDLSLFVIETGHGLDGNFEYNTDLFDDATITRMIGHFQRLLESIVKQPGERISRLSLLPAAELDRVLVEWNKTALPLPEGERITDLFEAQARHTPDAVALVCGERALTYRELDAGANRLAHHLQALGVKAESLVGVCMDRSPELVIALLAVLKAGGAYVPLDPAYPENRLGYILEDAQAAVLLAGPELLDRLPRHRSNLVCVAPGLQAFQHEPIDPPESGAAAGNLAYVIYTSGSTGRPKGVAIEHRSTVAFIHWARTVFGPDELAGVLASTSICFDLSVFELFVTLCCGGTVILVPNALGISSAPPAYPVTLINTVPSAITELLNQKRVPATVRTVNLAGEPLQTSLVDRLYRETRLQKVFDLYGPSEDTTYSTFTLRKAGERATIGHPIANTQAYILSPGMQPLPAGVPGELCLAGAGLARGYLRRPDLTAEKFIPDPFGPAQGGRLYRTGDLACFLPSGEIEFLGRRDNQVKIRGFRIELGEIEIALRRMPRVHEAVVLAREDLPGEKRLVAYLVADAAQPPSVTELRKYLGQSLPDYMVPGVFVFLEALPLTPNGKVDRRALPAPDQARPVLGGAFVAPRTDLEAQIARVWQKVLRLDKVGVEDNFFDLGGHSLLLAEAHALLQTALNRAFPMVEMYRYPTVGALSGFLLLEKGPVLALDAIQERARRQTAARRPRLANDANAP